MIQQDANDIANALKAQRNAAMDSTAELSAMVNAAGRTIQELMKKNADLTQQLAEATKVKQKKENRKQRASS